MSEKPEDWIDELVARSERTALAFSAAEEAGVCCPSRRMVRDNDQLAGAPSACERAS
jgi:hypothetical protein